MKNRETVSFAGEITLSPATKTYVQIYPQFAKEVRECITRYFNKDWGDISPEMQYDQTVVVGTWNHTEGLRVQGHYDTKMGYVDIHTGSDSNRPGSTNTMVFGTILTDRS